MSAMRAASSGPMEALYDTPVSTNSVKPVSRRIHDENNKICGHLVETVQNRIILSCTY